VLIVKTMAGKLFGRAVTPAPGVSPDCFTRAPDRAAHGRQVAHFGASAHYDLPGIGERVRMPGASGSMPSPRGGLALSVIPPGRDAWRSGGQWASHAGERA
jgi:hypothetical protein